MLEISTLLLAGFGMAFYVAWGIGANDETMALLAGSGFTTVKVAAFLGAVMAFLGAVLLGRSVEETIGKGLLLGEVDVVDAMIILFSMATWLTIASYGRWPISTTHSAIGAAIGLGLAKWGLSGVNWGNLINIASVLVLSPLIGLFGVTVTVRIVCHILRRYTAGLRRGMKIARRSAALLVVWSCINAFSRGANDVAKATAFLSIIYRNSLVVRALAGVGIMLGLMVLGRRVIKSVGQNLVRIDPVMALSAEVTVALIMLIGTLLGLPLSGTQILVGAVIGVGSARRIWINIKGLREVVVTWLATFLVTTVICATTYLVISKL